MRNETTRNRKSRENEKAKRKEEHTSVPSAA